MNQGLLINQITQEELESIVHNAVSRAFNHRTPEASTGDEFLNIQEAAILLNLSVPTIYGKVHRRELPYIKQGKKLRFLKLDLTNYLKQGRQQTASEILENAGEFVKIRRAK